jgi:uncharacterized protein
MFGMPLFDLVELAVATIAAGVVTGLLAGLFGIGGGAVIVPVLYEAFRLAGVPEQVRMQLCVGTSLAIIVPTTVRSYLAHRARGLVIPEVMQLWAAPAIAGVALGSIAAVFAPAALFKAAFVLIISLIAAKMLLGRDSWALGEALPGRAAMAGYGFLVGLGSSLVGISGGSLVTAILTLYRRSIHSAVATASGIGVPITIAGAIGYALAGLPHESELPPLSIGFVSVIGLVMIAPISSYVAPLGARLAHAASKRQLEIGFGMFLVLAAGRFLWSLVAHE